MKKKNKMLRETQIRERRNLRLSLIMSCRIIIRVKLQNFRRRRSVGYIGSRCNKERKVVRVLGMGMGMGVYTRPSISPNNACKQDIQKTPKHSSDDEGKG